MESMIEKTYVPTNDRAQLVSLRGRRRRLRRRFWRGSAACEEIEGPAYHRSSSTAVRPRGCHCKGDANSSAQMPARSAWCQGLPIQRTAEAMMAEHQTADCIDVAY